MGFAKQRPGLQKCAGVSRGNGAKRNDLGERKPRRFSAEAYTILLCDGQAYTISFFFI